MTIRESLKLDMTQPENGYALILDYYNANPDRIFDDSGRNLSHCFGALWAGRKLLTESIERKLVELEEIFAKGETQ